MLVLNILISLYKYKFNFPFPVLQGAEFFVWVWALLCSWGCRCYPPRLAYNLFARCFARSSLRVCRAKSPELCSALRGCFFLFVRSISLSDFLLFPTTSLHLHRKSLLLSLIFQYLDIFFRFQI